MTIELVAVGPLLVLFLLLAVGFGRYATTRQQVVGAARAAADAAAVAVSPAQAQGDAEAAAAPVLQAERACKVPTVRVDIGNFVPGGMVTVAVTCSVSMADLLIPGFPGSSDVRAVERAPIDPYRTIHP